MWAVALGAWQQLGVVLTNAAEACAGWRQPPAALSWCSCCVVVVLGVSQNASSCSEKVLFFLFQKEIFAAL